MHNEITQNRADLINALKQLPGEDPWTPAPFNTIFNSA